MLSFFLLLFSQGLASHLDQRIHIVFSLRNVSLQQPDLDVSFQENLVLQSWNDAMAWIAHFSLSWQKWH